MANAVLGLLFVSSAAGLPAALLSAGLPADLLPKFGAGPPAPEPDPELLLAAAPPTFAPGAGLPAPGSFPDTPPD